MNLNFQAEIPVDFTDTSRVWIYQSSRKFTDSELPLVNQALDQFVANWNSHGDPVKGFAKVFFNRFIVLLADEAVCGVSGCSTDTSVRVIRQIGDQLQINLFDRQQLAFVIDGGIKTFQMSQVKSSIEEELITPTTCYFDNTILRKRQLLDKWIIPVNDSWLARRFFTRAGATA